MATNHHGGVLRPHRVLHHGYVFRVEKHPLSVDLVHGQTWYILPLLPQSTVVVGLVVDLDFHDRVGRIASDHLLQDVCLLTHTVGDQVADVVVPALLALPELVGDLPAFAHDLRSFVCKERPHLAGSGGWHHSHVLVVQVLRWD